MTTDTTFQFSRNQELLEEVSQFQSQVLNFMITMDVSDTQEIIADEIQAYKVYDVWVNNGGTHCPLKYH